MIYEYPEEFIVPILYVNDLKDKGVYRYKKSKSLPTLGKLVIPDEESQGDEIFPDKVDIYGDFQNKEMNFLNMGGDLLQNSMIKEDIVEEGLEYEDIKSILSDIDEEYANSETLSM